jgi:ankyrin repeat protein
MWVMYAKRPLNMIELRNALGTDELDCDRKSITLDTIDVILGACANLLVVDGAYKPWGPGFRVLRPVHYSVQEFFQKPPNGVLERCCMAKINDASYMHSQLAITCLSHLRSRVTTIQVTDAGTLQRLIYYDPFMWYAACSFDYHILNSSILSNELQREISAFLQQKGLFFTTVLQLRAVKSATVSNRMLDIDMDFDLFYSLVSLSTMVFATELYSVPGLQGQFKCLKPDALALHRACLGGSASAVARLLADGCDIDAKTNQGTSPIYCAAGREDVPILRLLLQKGADVNAQGGLLHTALQVACYRGAQKNVKLLLEYQVDINAQGGEYTTALAAGSSQGHLEIVKLLLDNEADVNAQRNYYRSALMEASSQGHLEIVKLLLNNKADVNTQVEHLGNALMDASSRGHLEIVKLLLDNKADVNAQEEYLGNALRAASFKGYLEIVKLLLDNKAHVNSQANYPDNALIAAISQGHLEIVNLLISKGADVHSRFDSISALYAASSRGYTKIVALLLASGATYEKSHLPNTSTTEDATEQPEPIYDDTSDEETQSTNETAPVSSDYE